MIRLLFEQSGTFKNEFIKLGYDAIDYDIENQFGQTDVVIDLFNEINKAYDNQPSIFDTFTSNDLIMAFFPCVRFSDQMYMWFRGTNWSQRNWSDIKKLEYDIKIHNELNELYTLISKLAIICLRRNFKLIIENPRGCEHYLTRYWCLQATIIDNDRTKDGDYFKKPTQYWFINCGARLNVIEDYVSNGVTKRVVDTNNKIERSLISPTYANRFIRKYIID